jgi:hypothetical protein
MLVEDEDVSALDRIGPVFPGVLSVDDRARHESRMILEDLLEDRRLAHPGLKMGFAGDQPVSDDDAGIAGEVGVGDRLQDEEIVPPVQGAEVQMEPVLRFGGRDPLEQEGGDLVGRELFQDRAGKAGLGSQGRGMGDQGLADRRISYDVLDQIFEVQNLDIVVDHHLDEPVVLLLHAVEVRDVFEEKSRFIFRCKPVDLVAGPMHEHRSEFFIF